MEGKKMYMKFKYSDVLECSQLLMTSFFLLKKEGVLRCLHQLNTVKAIPSLAVLCIAQNNF